MKKSTKNNPVEERAIMILEHYILANDDVDLKEFAKIIEGYVGSMNDNLSVHLSVGKINADGYYSVFLHSKLRKNPLFIVNVHKGEPMLSLRELGSAFNATTINLALVHIVKMERREEDDCVCNRIYFTYDNQIDYCMNLLERRFSKS